MSDSQSVEVKRDGAVCVVELRREHKLNALSAVMEERLGEAIRSPEVGRARCVVFTGGGRVFSAGADVTEFRDSGPASVMAYYRSHGDVYERVARLPQPTVSAIAGYCLGGGFELALATDLRIAERSATFGLPEVGLGIIPGSGGLLRVARAVGPARAKDLILRGRRLEAAEAYSLGLVTEVVDDGDALRRALEIAEELAALPPLALQVAKRSIDLAADSSREAVVAMEQLAYGMLSNTADAQEAATAFAEKRPPRFDGA
ncbi:MAG: enoyl-CoA hydratase/isomerase family protein [Gaiellales bacterium]